MAREPSRIVATAPVPRRMLGAYRELARRDLNFEPISFADASLDPSWNVDERSEALPSEPPGPPLPDGVFATARQVLIDYEFADPTLVRAVYDASDAFDGRNMLLVGRFLGLRFAMGVRVGGVVEGVTTDAAGDVERFGWYYRTLEGHLEQGHMGYEVSKRLDTGEIALRIRAYSRRAPLRNPIVRLGLAVFGRREQLKFYERCFTRMQLLVEERARSERRP